MTFASTQASQAHASPHVNSKVKSNVNIRATPGTADVFWILEKKELNEEQMFCKHIISLISSIVDE